MHRSAAPALILPWARCCVSHLSAANAAKYGVSVQAEAVADNKHTVYLIAEAGDEEQMNKFLAPFAQAGSVELLPASSCEVVVSRGGCACPYSPDMLHRNGEVASL